MPPPPVGVPSKDGHVNRQKPSSTGLLPQRKYLLPKSDGIDESELPSSQDNLPDEPVQRAPPPRQFRQPPRFSLPKVGLAAPGSMAPPPRPNPALTKAPIPRPMVPPQSRSDSSAARSNTRADPASNNPKHPAPTKPPQNSASKLVTPNPMPGSGKTASVAPQVPSGSPGPGPIQPSPRRDSRVQGSPTKIPRPIFAPKIQAEGSRRAPQPVATSKESTRRSTQAPHSDQRGDPRAQAAAYIPAPVVTPIPKNAARSAEKRPRPDEQTSGDNRVQKRTIRSNPEQSRPTPPNVKVASRTSGKLDPVIIDLDDEENMPLAPAEEPQPPASIVIEDDGSDEDILPDEDYHRILDAFEKQLNKDIGDISNLAERDQRRQLNKIWLAGFDDVQKSQRRLVVPQAPKGRADGTLDRYSDVLVEAYGHSLRNLVRAAFSLMGMPCDGWVAARMKSPPAEFAVLETECVTMLASIDPLILKHIVSGDLPAAEHKNRKLRDMLAELKRKRPSDIFPSIYIQYLVDSSGTSPTAAELSEMLDDVELYIEGYDKTSGAEDSVEFAVRVDSRQSSGIFNQKTSGRGIRRYCKKDSHLKTLKAWIANTRSRLVGCPPGEPLKRPLCEVGWAKKLKQRLDAHAKHTSSNYIMNLVDAISAVKYRKYFIAQYGIFHIFDQVHAMLGEILCSRIAQAYISHGGGFSHHAAGISHQGANTMLEDDYRDLKLRVYAEPGFKERMEYEARKKLDTAKEMKELHGQYHEVIKRKTELSEELPKQFRELSEVTEERDNLFKGDYTTQTSPWEVLLRQFGASHDDSDGMSKEL